MTVENETKIASPEGLWSWSPRPGRHWSAPDSLRCSRSGVFAGVTYHDYRGHVAAGVRRDECSPALAGGSP